MKKLINQILKFGIVDSEIELNATEIANDIIDIFNIHV